MRNVSEATRITKIVSKVLGVLEKEELTDEQVVSVIKATGETLGIDLQVERKCTCDCECSCDEHKDDICE